MDSPQCLFGTLFLQPLVLLGRPLTPLQRQPSNTTPEPRAQP
ncbi:hypothetical protein SynPROS71_01735 [Synechococcus sp. PROS-7-1]|nr:hypothetical protein SynPROS71_01735 [Synechococcus sp. PROS-7-1]